MQAFFEVFAVILAVVTTIINLLFIGRLIDVNNQLEYSSTEFDKQLIELNEINKEHHRFLQEVKTYFTPSKPNRPNNWETIRDAFSGPVKVEKHERN